MGYLRPNFTVVVAPEYLHRFRVDPVQANLNITAVTPSDSGIYTVEVSPLGSAVEKGNITVVVYEQVGNVSVSPLTAAVAEGNDSVTLICSPVRGSVSWAKDGKALPENPRYLRSGGALQIDHLLRQDAGLYQCTVSNPFGNGTATAQLSVYYGPETPTITISSSSDQEPESGSFVLVNSSVNLTCLAPSQPLAKIYWNVADIQDTFVPSVPVLHLPRVNLNQAGPYTCLAFNQQTQRRVRSTRNLVVAQRPIGSPLCSVTSADNGTALLFVCSWPGGSPDPSLTFQGLSGYEEEVSTSSVRQLLTSPFPPELSGNRVTCLGRHLAAQSNCSVTPEAPSGVSLSFWAYDDADGSVTVEFHCHGKFNPVQIDWLRDRRPLAGGRYQLSSKGNRLTIWNFTAPQDLGDYSVNCSNPLGSQNSSLTVVGPSITDWMLSHGTLPGSAYITWTVPNRSVVTNFWIQTQDATQRRSAEEWKTVDVLGATNRSATIVGLEPQTSYSFRVVPRLGSQTGDASSVQILQPEGSHLSSGAIAGIVVGSILGMFLITGLLMLLFFYFRRGSNKKIPPTPPETRQHYLSRQFPNGSKLEPYDHSWGNPRWSSEGSDIYAITYEKHLGRYGDRSTLPIDASDSSTLSSAIQPGTKKVRSATQV
ncbi:V-set and immunoglobulin domain-containing protein 10-like [Hemicordylus capensis]|uniref:V-set and immunoglobulin domain-containing protein 10-like n=1 Tax=Hemicordylus capensis TaxID=884348 RepID=UPI0023036701|nr:V-set and immunoglobulin domain-containing protein 10-like [Hemicordylus capensis]